MNFTMRDVKNEGFELVEEVYSVLLETPVDLDSVGRININDLDYGTYYVVDDEQNINCDNGETFFSLYKDGENILLSAYLKEVKEYLNNYFESKGVK